MVNDNERVKWEGVLGAWIPLVIVTIVMVVLTFALFGSWQFWMWFAEMGAAIPVVIVSILYYGRDSKKCPNCSSRMDFDVQYCKKCGTHIPSKCIECGADIQPSGAFCEKCGVNLLGTQSVPRVVSNNKLPQNPQPVEKSKNNLNGNYKYCPACGNKTESYANHCSHCGIEL